MKPRYRIIWRRPWYLTLEPDEYVWELRPLEYMRSIPIGQWRAYTKPCFDYKRVDGTRPECHAEAW